MMKSWKVADDEMGGSIDQSHWTPETLAATCGVTLEDPVGVEVVVEDAVWVVVTPPLTLAPVEAPTLVTEHVAAVDVERVLAVVVAAGFAAAPAVNNDDDAAPFCNADIKLTPIFDHGSQTLEAPWYKLLASNDLLWKTLQLVKKKCILKVSKQLY